MLFRGNYWFLSNMYPIKIIENGIIYNSSENYYQAHKTDDLKLHKQIASVTPKESKIMGRKVKLIKNWDSIKINIMEKALRLKFSDNKLICKLMDTRNIELIEDNTWNDTFWGKYNSKGKNILGKLLMDLRKEFLLYEGD